MIPLDSWADEGLFLTGVHTILSPLPDLMGWPHWNRVQTDT